MHLAIISIETNKVVNVAVLPDNTWVCPDGFIAVETEIGSIGNTYNNGEFIKNDEP